METPPPSGPPTEPAPPLGPNVERFPPRERTADPPRGPEPGAGPVPPARRGRPWWLWALGCCGSCALVSILAFAALTYFGFNLFKSVADVGPIDPVTMQRDLGEDVPLYPGGTLDVNITRGMLITFRTMEKVGGKPKGSIFKGVAVVNTADSPDKVLSYYDRQLTQNGWSRMSGQGAQDEKQRQYRKGDEVVMVQVQERPDGQPGSQVILMRIVGPENVPANIPRNGPSNAPEDGPGGQ
jgi:hypothetical protein